MEKETDLLKTTEDKGLLGELDKDRSFFEMTGLVNGARAGFTGLMASNEYFTDKQLPLVNHFVREAQASFRLGRPTNLASSMIHVTVNDLSPGVQANSFKDQQKMICNPGEPTSYT